MDLTNESLKELFERYIKFNTAKGLDNINYSKFKEDIDINIEFIKNGIEKGNYKFSYFKEILLLKGAKKHPRVISVPTISDKMVLKFIHINLKEKCHNIKHRIPNEYIRELKKDIDKYDYANKYDIKNFYDNINHDILLEKLNKYNLDKNIVDLIKKSIKKATVPMYTKGKRFRRKGLPQGLSISNILSEIYLSDLVDEFSDLNVKLVRYVDDLIILYNKNLNVDLTTRLEYSLSKLKLKINKQKKKEEINLNLGDFDFLGYRYKQIYNKFNGFSVKKENIHKFERKIVSIFVRYDKDNKISEKQFIFTLNNIITGTISKKVDTDSERTSRYGWLFFYSQIDDYTIPYNLDRFIEKLLEKYKSKKGGKWNNIKISEIKKFVKAFSFIKIRDYSYVHKPDELSFKEKKELLMDIFNIHINELYTEEKINKIYYKLVYKPIKLYQKDIQGFNSSL